MATAPKPRRRQRRDNRRENSHDRGYTGDWRKARKAYLREHALCEYCRQRGVITPATVVDHIVPHKGDQSLFWDEENWQPLCAVCHNRKSATE